MSQKCRVFDLMVDTVELWLRDNNITTSPEKWSELVERLYTCNKQLENRFECRSREESSGHNQMEE